MRQQEPSRLLYSLGPGRFKRGPTSIKRPDPATPRKWVYDSEIDLTPGDIDVGTAYPSKGPYAIVLISTQEETLPGSGKYQTVIYYIYWGLKTEKIVKAGTSYDVISASSLYTGILEEVLQVQTSEIVGVWVSPVPPLPLTSNYIVTKGTTAYYKAYAGTSAVSAGPGPYEYFMDIAETTADDSHKIVFMNPNNAILSTTAWGTSFKRLRLTVDVGCEGAWLLIDLINSTNGTRATPGEDRIIQLPLMSVPVTSNDKSDYAISGQQEYDRTMAMIQREQNLASGVTGIGTSAITGAIMGSVAPGIGTAVGAVAGIISGAVGLGANQYISSSADNKSFAAMDKLLSNQASNIIVGGGGISWYTFGYSWKMITLIRDPVSSAELAAEHTELGYITDTYAADCSTIISQGGGLRIEGLEVRGAISREGREYIAALFARGVHIDILT